MLKTNCKQEIEKLEGNIEKLKDLRKGRRREASEIEEQQFQIINELVDKDIMPNLPERMKDIDFSKYVDETQVLSYLALALTGRAGKSLELKTAQLRRFFDPLKSIEQRVFVENKKWDDVKTDFVLLTPKLAYAKGKGLIPQPFYHLVMDCLKRVDSKEDLKSLIQFLETVVAYHKYHGSKNVGGGD